MSPGQRRQVDALLDQHTDAQVARILNEQDMRTGAGDSFELDVLECGRCGGRMRILAALHSSEAIRRILECLGLKILALRQQLGILKRKYPRPRLRIQDRRFWIPLCRLWPAWNKFLVIVKPKTVVAWHRAGFRLFWRIRSRPKSRGRPKIDAELRALIRRIAEEDKTLGAPRIHGELLKLGSDSVLSTDRWLDVRLLAEMVHELRRVGLYVL